MFFDCCSVLFCQRALSCRSIFQRTYRYFYISFIRFDGWMAIKWSAKLLRIKCVIDKYRCCSFSVHTLCILFLSTFIYLFTKFPQYKCSFRFISFLLCWCCCSYFWFDCLAFNIRRTYWWMDVLWELNSIFNNITRYTSDSIELCHFR